MRTKLWILLFLLAALPAYARNFYIDPVAGTDPASCSGTCTAGAPCKTWNWFYQHCGGASGVGATGPHTVYIVGSDIDVCQSGAVGCDATWTLIDVDAAVKYDGDGTQNYDTSGSYSDHSAFIYIPKAMACSGGCTLKPLSMFDTTNITYPEAVRYTNVAARTERTWPVRFRNTRSIPDNSRSFGVVIADSGWTIEGFDFSHVYTCLRATARDNASSSATDITELVVEYNRCSWLEPAPGSSAFTFNTIRDCDSASCTDISGDENALVIKYNWAYNIGVTGVELDPAQMGFESVQPIAIKTVNTDGLLMEGNWIYGGRECSQFSAGRTSLITSTAPTRDVVVKRNRLEQCVGHGSLVSGLRDGDDADSIGMLVENNLIGGSASGRCLSTAGNYATLTSTECWADSDCTGLYPSGECWEAASYCRLDTGSAPDNNVAGVCGSFASEVGGCSDVKWDEGCGTTLTGKCDQNPYMSCSLIQGGAGGLCVKEGQGTDATERDYWTQYSPGTCSNNTSCATSNKYVTTGIYRTQTPCQNAGGLFQNNKCYMCDTSNRLSRSCIAAASDERNNDVCVRSPRQFELKDASLVVIRNNDFVGYGYNSVDRAITVTNDSGLNSDRRHSLCGLYSDTFGDAYDVDPYNAGVQTGFCSVNRQGDALSCTASSCPSCGGGRTCTAPAVCYPVCLVDGEIITNNIFHDYPLNGGWFTYSNNIPTKVWNHHDEVMIDGNIFSHGHSAGTSRTALDSGDIGALFYGGQTEGFPGSGFSITGFMDDDSTTLGACCTNCTSSSAFSANGKYCSLNNNNPACALGTCTAGPASAYPHLHTMRGRTLYGETQCNTGDNNWTGTDEGLCSDNSMPCTSSHKELCTNPSTATCSADADAGCQQVRDISDYFVNYAEGNLIPQAGSWLQARGLSADRQWRGVTTCASEDYFGNARTSGRCTPGAITVSSEPPAPSVCGNGIIESGEECDDGNTTAGDGCDADCLIEPTPSCGDGHLDLGEVCDDGNNTACDGCSADCLSTEDCGNGITECTEECDDGNVANGDGCNSTCQIESSCTNAVTNGDFSAGNLGWTFFTNGTGSFSTASNNAVVTISTLGSNMQLYQYNISVLGSTLYRLRFTGSSTTGDPVTVKLIKHTSAFGNYGLNATIALTSTPTAKSVTFTTTSTNKTDGRLMFVFAGVASKGAVYTLDDIVLEQVGVCSGVCGDGNVDVGEACDDGNTDNTDACLNTCVDAACGDAIVEVGVEQCDDGNVISGDGCSSTCIAEAASILLLRGGSLSSGKSQ